MANHTPTAQGNNESGVAPGSSVALSSLFSYSDADGLSDIVSFDVRLQTTNGGHLYHNGVLWPDGQLTPDQPISTLSEWTYVSGPAGTSDTIGFNVTDQAGAFNPTVTATVATQAVNHTPTAQGNNESGVAPGSSVALSSLFSYSDADGLSDIVSFDVRLQTTNGGHLYHNGVLWPDGQLTPDQPISTLSEWTYVSGPAGTSDTIGFNVTDQAGAFNPTVTATVATQAVNHTPTAQGNNESGVAPGSSVALSSLFSYSDADGLSDIVSFDVRLQTTNGGHLYHNGVLWPDGQLTPDQPISTLSEWTYVSGPAGTSDTIGFNVTDQAGAFNPTVTATVSVQGSQTGGIAFAGFDSEFFPAHPDTMEWIKTNTNLAWCGYYLDAPSQRLDTGWLGEKSYLEILGWQIAPIYVGQQDPSYNGGTLSYSPSSQQGIVDGNEALAQLGPITSATEIVYNYNPATGHYDIPKTVVQGQGFAPGTTVFLDLSSGRLQAPKCWRRRGIRFVVVPDNRRWWL